MKALVYMGPKQMEIRERPMPVIKLGEALIKVKYCGICGSDLKMYRGKHSRIQPDTVLGHEFVGQIVDLKTDNSLEVKIGDYVVVEPIIHCHSCYYCKTGRYNLCNKRGIYGCEVDGAFAEFVKVSIDKMIKVLDVSDLKKMSLVEPLAVAVSAVNKCNVKVGDKALVLGGGPIGLLIGQVFQFAGVSNIILSEINNFRLEKAKKLGFEAVNPKEIDLGEYTKTLNKDGVDIVIDTVGYPSAIKSALSLVRRGGLINIVSLYSESVPIDLLKIVYSELTLKGTFIYTYNDFLKAKELLEAGLIKVKPLISAIYPLKDAAKVFKEIEEGEIDYLKILIEI